MTNNWNICPNPIFVIGSPRSGTSALPWSLAQHSNLWTSDETEFFPLLFGQGRAEQAFAFATRRNRTWLNKHSVSKACFIEHLGVGLNALISQQSGGLRWIDQTPANTLMAETLCEMFAGAKFLHILRDGRRVVQSMITFGDSIGAELKASGNLPEWTRGVEAAALTWVQYAEHALAFCETNPSRALTVVNEHLVEQPSAGFREILDFLQEPYEPAPAAFFHTCRINSSSGLSVWGKTNGDSAQAQPYSLQAPWTSWSEDDRRIFDSVAGDLMERVTFMTAAERELFAK